jgi:hypothetical protein
MMNFKLKAVVAAIALAASMSANAAMTNNISGDSSLILTLLDNTNNISMTVDLGFSNSSFDRNGNASWNIAGGDYSAAWDTYWTTATAATTQWAVVSGDKLVPSQVFTTMSTLAATAPSYSQISTATGNFDTYINANNLLGNHQAVANGASTAAAGNAFAENGIAYGTNGTYNGILGDTTGVLGSNLSVYTFSTPAASGLTKAVVAQYATGTGFNPYFNMSSNGALTYTAAVAAVPEADISAMLLAGLGMMGFIARRRTRNAV